MNGKILLIENIDGTPLEPTPEPDLTEAERQTLSDTQAEWFIHNWIRTMQPVQEERKERLDRKLAMHPRPYLTLDTMERAFDEASEELEFFMACLPAKFRERYDEVATKFRDQRKKFKEVAKDCRRRGIR